MGENTQLALLLIVPLLTGYWCLSVVHCKTGIDDHDLRDRLETMKQYLLPKCLVSDLLNDGLYFIM